MGLHEYLLNGQFIDAIDWIEGRGEREVRGAIIGCISYLFAEYGPLFAPFLDEMLSQNEELTVCIGKLFLLYRRAEGEPSFSNGCMEREIEDLIPTSVKLDAKTASQYSRLLATPGCARYLVAMAHVFHHGTDLDYYHLVRYILHKRPRLQLRDQWPAPIGVSNEDPVWWIWGALLHFRPKDPAILNRYRAFASVGGGRNQYTGLLLVKQTGLTQSWSEDERMWLSTINSQIKQGRNDRTQKIIDNYAHKIPENVVQEPLNTWKKQIEKDDMFQVFLQFVPRGRVTMDHEEFKEEVKKIRLSSNTRCPPLSQP